MDRHSDRIVVGLDDSTGARAALVYALHDAARRGAALDVVSVCELPDYWEPAPTAAARERVREATRARAVEIVEQVCAAEAGAFARLPPIEIEVADGDAATALVDAARDADLLVVGSRGRGGYAQHSLGSVGLQCVLRATCPVTVVHPSAAQSAPADTAGYQAVAT